MTKLQKILVFSTFAIFLFAMIGFVALRYRDSDQPNDDQAKNLNSEPEDDSAPDSETYDLIDTSDWKTYRSEEYGFEVKYPNTWHTEDCDSYFIAFGGEPRLLYCGTDMLLTAPVHISIGVDTTSLESEVGRHQESLNNPTRSIIILDGKEAALLKGTNSSMKLSIYAIFHHRGKNFKLFYVARNGSGSEDVFNAMLLTFRFID